MSKTKNPDRYIKLLQLSPTEQPPLETVVDGQKLRSREPCIPPVPFPPLGGRKKEEGAVT